MVGIVIISHSGKLNEELINFAQMFKTKDFKLLNGTDSKLNFGTNIDYVVKTVKEANSGNGVLIFVDFGSSVAIALKVKEQLKNEVDIEITDAPLVEGLFSAVAGNNTDVNLLELKIIAEDSVNFRKVK